jgi:hypothetical protein
MSMANRFKRWLRRWPVIYYGLKRLHSRFSYRRQILYNTGELSDPAGHPRALLVYLVQPFLQELRSQKMFAHQNQWCALEIARLLGERGYVVDALNWDDEQTTVATTQYDLLIGFHRADDLAEVMPERTIKIYLATGSEVNFVNQRLRERIEDIRRRRGCTLPPVRQGTLRTASLKHFDAIACIGNAVTASTYRPHFSKTILNWNNHGYDQWLGIPTDKDFAAARRHFLYFASGGQVLLGLDLVLEAFVHRPQLTLHVCGPFENELEFAQCFHRELHETPNIMPVGWVAVGSNLYFELMRTCCATIFPIAAGGSPGSVVVCMSQGIIPVVSKEAGIDTEDFGLTLPANTIDQIGAAVDALAAQSVEWHAAQADRVLVAARDKFSQAAFTQRFGDILDQVIAEKTRYFSKD